jgi:serine-protein kinase ATM
MLSRSLTLQQVVNVSPKAARTIETRSLLAASSLFRRHEALQTCLGNATVLDSLVDQCKALGVLVDVPVQYEVSNVMWDQGEMVSSIQVLQDVLANSDLNAQTIPVVRPVLLARLGHRVSEARLEKPDEIISNYLVPAIQELHGHADGLEAGQVYHEFAAFCDQQLQNSDNREDMDRVQKLRDSKENEVRVLEKMLKAATSQSPERSRLKHDLNRAKLWLELDSHEYDRLRDGRQTLLQRSLENYLLCLKSCDAFDNDALRFSALWLESSENDAANDTVSKYLKLVPSGKFATLMNQWTSRLLELETSFQKLLTTLVCRICVDHPYHGMYHIFSSSKSKTGRDRTAISRYNAANNIVTALKANPKISHTWLAIHNTSINYVRFAGEKTEDGSMKQGARIALRRLLHGQRLEQDIKTLKVPPATMKIALRPNSDYSDIPVIQRYQSEFTIASGVSMPKILTVLASNGRKYKQLVSNSQPRLTSELIISSSKAAMTTFDRMQSWSKFSSKLMIS